MCGAPGEARSHGHGHWSTDMLAPFDAACNCAILSVVATRRTRPPLRTKGLAWGPERVRLGISLRELSRLAGINMGTLSHIEGGRMVPTAAEWSKVTAVLRDAEARLATGSTAEG